MTLVEDTERKTRTPVSVTTVEERMFKDGTWSLVVCHRIKGKERKEGNEKGQGEDRKEYVA